MPKVFMWVFFLNFLDILKLTKLLNLKNEEFYLEKAECSNIYSRSNINL